MKRILPFVIAVMAAIVGVLCFWHRLPFFEDIRTKTKVGVVLNGYADDRSWSQSHVEGLRKTAAALDVQLLIKEKTPPDKLYEAMDKLINEGCEVIVGVSFDHDEALLQQSVKHPDLKFLHVTGLHHRQNLSSFFGRMYQVRYLTGIVAGLQTQSNDIGYVAGREIPEVIRGINAFTLGVRSVNPQAQVHVVFAKDWNSDANAGEATRRLLQLYPDMDVLTMHVDSLEPLKVAEQCGIYSIGYNFENSELFPKTYLTAAVWKWENAYIPNIKELLQGANSGTYHWYGMEKDVVNMAALTNNVKPGIAQVVSKARKRLQNSAEDVFYGPVYDNTGKLRVSEGENIADSQLLSEMTWYVEGVVIDE